MRALNLAGKTFRNLVVISPTDKRNHERIVWRCRCLICGKEFEAVGTDIKKGFITSCGGHRESSTGKANEAIKKQVEKYGTVPGMLKQKKRSSNTSGYKGVSVINLKSGAKRYRAFLTVSGTTYRGARRETALQAYEDRLEMEREYCDPVLDKLKKPTS